MKFGKVEKIMLLGGGKLSYRLLKWLIEKKLSFVVVTDERHCSEIIDENKTFLQLLNGDGVKYILTNKIETSEVIKEITSETIGMSFGATWIFKKKFIDLFKNKLLNFHGSRLPQNRGGGGFSWRILMGEKRGYNTIHLVDEGIDTGEIIKCEEYIYPDSCRKPVDYTNYSVDKYYSFIIDFINEVLSEKEFTLYPQQETFSTYFPRLYTPLHGYINWSWNLKELEKFICAFDDPYEGTMTFCNDIKLHLKDCYPIYTDGQFHPFQCGIVYRITKYGITIAAKDGGLIVRNIVDDNKNTYIEKIKLGDRLYTPSKYLDEAMKFRAVYDCFGLSQKNEK